MRKKVSSINNYIYNSSIWYYSTRLIESCRTSSRLIKILHYWVLWKSRTRKSRSRNARNEISRRKRVTKSRKNRIFQQRNQFSSVFWFVFEKFMNQSLFFHIFAFFQIIESSSSRYNTFVIIYLFTTIFEVRRNKLCEYLR
jgi:hypothetical protein